MRTIHAIVDLQFGSTGKGLFAGFLAKNVDPPDTVVCAWGPNSGHTFVDRSGRKFVHTMIPNGIVSMKLKTILIGPGAIINPQSMMAEIMDAMDVVDGARIAIHGHAAVVTEANRFAESQYGVAIGSTMKGTAEAVFDKMRRNPELHGTAQNALIGTPLEGMLVSVEEYNDLLDASKVLQVEGCQGFSLSINHGIYPYVTSRDCTTTALFTDCGIPASWLRDAQVYGVARTFPIRVANRYRDCMLNYEGNDHKGCNACGGEGRTMIGTSGPGYPDQEELDWSSIGVEPELTTVTKLPRRLFTFSDIQVRQAIRMNGCNGGVFLNFCNYFYDLESIDAMARRIGQMGAPVKWLGHGPSEGHIIHVGAGGGL